MIEIILALLGILCGILLTYIAPEEIKTGKKYFVWLKRIVYILLLLVMVYLLTARIMFLVIFLLLGILLFVVSLKSKNKYLELPIYLLFIVALLIVEQQALPASLLFIYGLPTGTILRR
jgi:hypothetical protein